LGRTRKVGTTGRFGARAGSTLRKRRGDIERMMLTLHECPRCLSKSVRRLSVGVWKCHRCGYTFAGGAYAPSTELGVTARRSIR
jgi:large subunit ribosomal protein L37Ae